VRQQRIRWNILKVVSLALLLCGACAGMLGAETLFDTRGGVELWLEPDSPGPTVPGLVGLKVILKTKEPSHNFVTFENVNAAGPELHQVFLPGESGPTPTPNVDSFDPTTPVDWIASDSHLLIKRSMIGGEIGVGYDGITEDNDGSDFANADNLLSQVGGKRPATGAGSINGGDAADAFFLDVPYQTNSVDLYHLVAGAGSEVCLDMVLLHTGFHLNPVTYGRGGEHLCIPFVPEPSTAILRGLTSVILLGLRRRRNHGETRV
jgi:hypothetical protein